MVFGAFNLRKHGERKICDRRADFSAGVVAIDNLHNRMLQRFQIVKDDFISFSEVIAQPFYDRYVGLQDHTFVRC